MSREGSAAVGLLYDLHGEGCDGTEYSSCRPVVVPSEHPERGMSAKIEVVYMEWCGECGAADWEAV